MMAVISMEKNGAYICKYSVYKVRDLTPASALAVEHRDKAIVAVKAGEERSPFTANFRPLC